MTVAQFALLAGALIGAGLAVLLLRWAPAYTDLGDFLSRTDLRSQPTAETGPAEIHDSRDRLGFWLMRTFPLTTIVKPPTTELAILRIPQHRFYAEKVLFGLVGVLMPTLAAVVLTVAGIALPVMVPVAASLAIGVAMSFVPDMNIRGEAAEARQEFRHALAAYIDLVAMERNAGSGARQALEVAAKVGDSWVFQRISEELVYSRWSGVTPWDSLTKLGDELGLSDLSDLADIMRISGEEGAASYQALRARAASMRSALQSSEMSSANAAVERLSMPTALLFVLFMMLLVTPSLLRVVFGG